MQVYKTSKNYFYKKYKNGKIKRISKNEFIKKRKKYIGGAKFKIDAKVDIHVPIEDIEKVTRLSLITDIASGLEKKSVYSPLTSPGKITRKKNFFNNSDEKSEHGIELEIEREHLIFMKYDEEDSNFAWVKYKNATTEMKIHAKYLIDYKKMEKKNIFGYSTIEQIVGNQGIVNNKKINQFLHSAHGSELLFTEDLDTDSTYGIKNSHAAMLRDIMNDFVPVMRNGFNNFFNDMSEYNKDITKLYQKTPVEQPTDDDIIRGHIPSDEFKNKIIELVERNFKRLINKALLEQLLAKCINESSINLKYTNKYNECETLLKTFKNYNLILISTIITWEDVSRVITELEDQSFLHNTFYEGEKKDFINVKAQEFEKALHNYIDASDIEYTYDEDLDDLENYNDNDIEYYNKRRYFNPRSKTDINQIKTEWDNINNRILKKIQDIQDFFHKPIPDIILHENQLVILQCNPGCTTYSGIKRALLKYLEGLNLEGLNEVYETNINLNFVMELLSDSPLIKKQFCIFKNKVPNISLQNHGNKPDEDKHLFGLWQLPIKIRPNQEIPNQEIKDPIFDENGLNYANVQSFARFNYGKRIHYNKKRVTDYKTKKEEANSKSYEWMPENMDEELLDNLGKYSFTKHRFKRIMKKKHIYKWLNQQSGFFGRMYIREQPTTLEMSINEIRKKFGEKTPFILWCTACRSGERYHKNDIMLLTELLKNISEDRKIYDQIKDYKKKRKKVVRGVLNAAKVLNVAKHNKIRQNKSKNKKQKNQSNENNNVNQGCLGNFCTISGGKKVKKAKKEKVKRGGLKKKEKIKRGGLKKKEKVKRGGLKKKEKAKRKK